MKYEVTCLRDRGRRVRASEVAQRPVGDLSVCVQEPLHRGGVARRVALLTVSEGYLTFTHQRQLLPPLFNPLILTLEGGLLELAGIELHHEAQTGETYEHHQVWRCRPLNGASDPQAAERAAVRTAQRALQRAAAPADAPAPAAEPSATERQGA